MDSLLPAGRGEASTHRHEKRHLDTENGLLEERDIIINKMDVLTEPEPIPPTAEQLKIESMLEEMGGQSEFMTQLGGSGAANILTALLFFLLWVCKNKFKHSECSGNSFCCTFKVKDDESVSHEAEGEVRQV